MYIEMREVSKHFGKFAAIDDVSLGLEEGQFVALLGPSGSGKTTILRVLAGLEKQDAGHLFIDGRCVDEVPAARRDIGFVFQNYALFRYLTVFENIAFPLRVKKWPRAKICERVFELTELVGLSGFEQRHPAQLSGGQRQRVAFARALAANPKILLLDEPFAAIDAKVRAELRTWLREMVAQVGITSIFVTHDQTEALEVADLVVVTNAGRIDQVGTPAQVYHQPATPFVEDFITASIDQNVAVLREITRLRS